MKQVIQNLSNGETDLLDTPAPAPKPGFLNIRTTTTLISAGTEKMLLDFGRGSWLSKARQQPDKVRQVLNKVKTDGLAPTLDAVRDKLDSPLPLGYCNVGRALHDGGSFQAGDRIACNGNHAEIVNVPYNLCARIPDGVSDEEAAFTVVGAIALHGIRIAGPEIGECFAVIGLGLIGQLTVMLLRAGGCKVLGVDFNPERCRAAAALGAEVVCPPKGEDPLAAARETTGGMGVDGVLITAATRSSEPVRQAAEMCRKRGRIVLVGVTGLQLSRDLFYKKEIRFQVSCSYGPGRYDPAYEEGGADYPPAYVRWTEQRNFVAFLDLLAMKMIDVSPLISHRFPLSKASDAYAMIAEGSEEYMGILLQFDEEASDKRTVALDPITTHPGPSPAAPPVVGFIGAGSYTGRTLLPALIKTRATLHTICATTGLSCTHQGRKFGFRNSSTDVDSVLESPDIDTVFITTRHDSHARFIVRALRAGKRVFTEKPLCITLEELEEVETAVQETGLPVMVGFNRRFAPLIVQMKELLAPLRAPMCMTMTVNAGEIPSDHWTQNPTEGGGRIIGEACHFIDLLRFMAGAPVTDSHAVFMDTPTRDTAGITLQFADGSIGILNYHADGHKSVPKERLEITCHGHFLRLDNFRALTGYGWKNRVRRRTFRQDKGQTAMIQSVVEALATRSPFPIPFEEITETSEIAVRLATGKK